MNITVTCAVNQPPVALDDTYEATEDTTLLVDAIDPIDGINGVLANDSDPDGDDITAVLVTGPSNGNLALNADGSFSYTPNADYCNGPDTSTGSDSFTYKAKDVHGEESAEAATVTLNVVCVNDAPIALDDGGSTQEGIPTNIDVLINDAYSASK